MDQIVIILEDDTLKKRIQKIILEKYFCEEPTFSFLCEYNEKTRMTIQPDSRIFYFLDCTHKLSDSIEVCKKIRRYDPEHLIVLLVLSTSQSNFIMTSKIPYMHCLLKNNKLKENILETLTFSFQKEKNQIVGGDIPVYSENQEIQIVDTSSRYSLLRNQKKDISLFFLKDKLQKEYRNPIFQLCFKTEHPVEIEVICREKKHSIKVYNKKILKQHQKGETYDIH